MEMSSTKKIFRTKYPSQKNNLAGCQHKIKLNLFFNKKAEAAYPSTKAYQQHHTYQIFTPFFISGQKWTHHQNKKKTILIISDIKKP